jgi:hypothetical protein
MSKRYGRGKGKEGTTDDSDFTDWHTEEVEPKERTGIEQEAEGRDK